MLTSVNTSFNYIEATSGPKPSAKKNSTSLKVIKVAAEIFCVLTCLALTAAGTLGLLGFISMPFIAAVSLTAVGGAGLLTFSIEKIYKAVRKNSGDDTSKKGKGKIPNALVDSTPNPTHVDKKNKLKKLNIGFKPANEAENMMAATLKNVASTKGKKLHEEEDDDTDSDTGSDAGERVPDPVFSPPGKKPVAVAITPTKEKPSLIHAFNDLQKKASILAAIAVKGQMLSGHDEQNDEEDWGK